MGWKWPSWRLSRSSGATCSLRNSILYLIGLIAKSMGIFTTFDQNLPLFMVYNVVGIGSIVTRLCR